MPTNTHRACQRATSRHLCARLRNGIIFAAIHPLLVDDISHRCVSPLLRAPISSGASRLHWIVFFFAGEVRAAAVPAKHSVHKAVYFVMTAASSLEKLLQPFSLASHLSSGFGYRVRFVGPVFIFEAFQRKSNGCFRINPFGFDTDLDGGENWIGFRRDVRDTPCNGQHNHDWQRDLIELPSLFAAP